MSSSLIYNAEAHQINFISVFIFRECKYEQDLEFKQTKRQLNYRRYKEEKQKRLKTLRKLEKLKEEKELKALSISRVTYYLLFELLADYKECEALF